MDVLWRNTYTLYTLFVLIRISSCVWYRVNAPAAAASYTQNLSLLLFLLIFLLFFSPDSTQGYMLLFRSSFVFLPVLCICMRSSRLVCPVALIMPMQNDAVTNPLSDGLSDITRDESPARAKISKVCIIVIDRISRKELDKCIVRVCDANFCYHEKVRR